MSFGKKCGCWVKNESHEVQIETPYFAHDATCAKYRASSGDPVEFQNTAEAVQEIRSKAQHILNNRSLNDDLQPTYTIAEYRERYIENLLNR